LPLADEADPDRGEATPCRDHGSGSCGPFGPPPGPALPCSPGVHTRAGVVSGSAMVAGGDAACGAIGGGGGADALI